MIRCVMFDFGNVLMHFDTQRFYDFVVTNQRPGSASPTDFFLSDGCVKYDLGQVNEFEFFESAKSTLGLNVKMKEFFFEFVNLMKPDLRMLELKHALRQNGIRLAVVSNTNRYHFEYVRQKWPEVFMNFDCLALSFQLGARKPEPRIWQIPARRLGVNLSECLFIDDLEVNTCEFERLGGISHHYQVTDEHFCSNGRLEIERNRLILRMIYLGILTESQAGKLMKINFSN